MISDSEWLDEVGYPTEDALNTISLWEGNYMALFAFMKSIWRAEDWGWSETLTSNDYYEQITRYEISTGGWSGNENIIEALQKNYMAWSFTWEQSRRGGHYIFEVKHLVEK